MVQIGVVGSGRARIRGGKKRYYLSRPGQATPCGGEEGGGGGEGEGRVDNVIK